MNACDLIMNDEKYLKLTGNNVVGNRYFHSTDPTPPKVNFSCKSKDADISSKGASDHNNKQVLNYETYLKEYLDQRQISLEWK